MPNTRLSLRPYVLKHIAVVLAAALLSWGVLCATKPSSAAPAAPAMTQPATPAKAIPDAIADAALRERLDALEERDRQNQQQILENERKQTDWWFSFLAVFTAVLGVGGALFPFLMARRDKEQMQDLLDRAEATARQIQNEETASRALLNKAQETARRIEQHEVRASTSASHIEDWEETLKNAQSPKIPARQDEVVITPKPENEKLEKAIEEVSNNPAASFATQLRAKAIAAERIRNHAQAEAAWRMLLGEEPNDAQACFGLGVSLHMQAEALQDKAPQTALRLWQEAGSHYAEALQINPSMHEAANNWGSALANQARALASTDLPAARALWAQAGERYAQALRIQPDKHEAANNWGGALSNEARVLALTDPPAARALWAQAGERYAQALRITPSMLEAAYNWGLSLIHEANTIRASDPEQAAALFARAEEKLRLAESCQAGAGAYNLACIHCLRGDAHACIEWLDTCKRHDTLPAKAHLESDSYLDPVRDTPAFKAWWQTTFGA